MILNSEIFSSEELLENEVVVNTGNQGVEPSQDFRAKVNSVTGRNKKKPLGESSKGNQLVTFFDNGHNLSPTQLRKPTEVPHLTIHSGPKMDPKKMSWANPSEGEL